VLKSQVLVAHACNPSYSRVRDQEDRGSKPTQAKSSQDPISKMPNTSDKTKQKNTQHKSTGLVK
jgi:hypothetical protein